MRTKPLVYKCLVEWVGRKPLFEIRDEDTRESVEICNGDIFIAQFATNKVKEIKAVATISVKAETEISLTLISLETEQRYYRPAHFSSLISIPKKVGSIYDTIPEDQSLDWTDIIRALEKFHTTYYHPTEETKS